MFKNESDKINNLCANYVQIFSYLKVCKPVYRSVWTNEDYGKITLIRLSFALAIFKKPLQLPLDNPFQKSFGIIEKNKSSGHTKEWSR